MEPTIINNRYRIVRELARGGMGRVFLVEDIHLDGRKMALKTMLPGLTSATFLERFRVEFAGLARLTHPNIATAFDFGQIASTGEHFFTTEFIDGVDLYTGTTDASVDQILSVTTQLLRGLDFIHSRKLLHNDLKPSNILLEPLMKSGDDKALESLTRLEAAIFGQAVRVRIIDFGLLSAENTAWSKVLGTPHYMSPERIRCQESDRRSDLYSAGIVLYTICARALPFKAPDNASYLKKQVEEPAPGLATRRPDLPRPMADLVDRLVRKSPDERFPSARATIQFLDDSLCGTSVVEVHSKAHGLATGALFGRGKETKVLEDMLEATVQARCESPCLVVEGAPGSGKTRLVDELRGSVQVQGGAFISVSGVAVEGHLRPVAEAVLRGLETIGASQLEALSKPLTATGAETCLDLTDGLERFVLDQARRRPIVIHFDDFHNSSGMLRSFVLGLVNSTHNEVKGDSPAIRLLIIVSQRPSARTTWLSQNGFTSFQLHPFTQDVAINFLERLFAQEQIPPGVTEPILRIATGNPGLLLELARELVERGLVRHNGTKWIFPSTLSEVPLPTSLTGILEERLQCLDGPSQALMEWIACTPDSMDSRVLGRCASMDDQELGPRLQELAGRGMVTLENPGRDLDQRCSLAHHDLRATVRDRMEPERKKFMHQGIAQAVEEAGDESGAHDERTLEALAYHWLEAGNTAGFLRYAPRAALSLQRGGNFAQATSYHKRIADAMPENAAAKKIQSLARLSEMHELLWDLDQSRQDLEAMLTLGQNLLRPGDRSAIHRRLACLEIASHAPLKALASLHEARRLLGSGLDALSTLGLDAPEALAAWLSGDKRRCWEALGRAEKLLSSYIPGNPREKALLASAANQVASLHHQMGHLKKAHDIYLQQLGFIEELGAIQAEAATLSAIGGLFLDLGEPSRALENLTRSLDLSKRAGDRRTLCKARDRLGEYHLRHGDVRSALLAAQAGLQDAETLRSPSARANALRTLGRIYLRAGQDADAEQVTREALDLHLTQGDTLGVPFSRVELARVLLSRGETGPARDQASRAKEEAQRIGIALAEGLALLLLAEVAARESDEAEDSLLASASEIFETSGYRYELCESRAWRCLRALTQGKVALATRVLETLAPCVATSGSEEHRLCLRLMQSLILLEEGNIVESLRSISDIETRARNAVLPRLAKMCKDMIRQIQIEATAS